MPDGDSRLALGYGLFRTAVNWGLRSPNSDSNNAYNINTDGTVNNNNVNNPNFAARPALMELPVKGTRHPYGGTAADGCPDRVQVAFWRKQRTIIKGGHILSSSQAPYPLLPPEGESAVILLLLLSETNPLTLGFGSGKTGDAAEVCGGDKHNGSDTGRLATGERPRTPHTGEILAAISAAKPAPTIQFQARMRDHDL